MDFENINEIISEMKEKYNIDVELEEEKYIQGKGYYAKNTFNLKNPLNPKVTYTDIATTEDVIMNFVIVY